jgi:hypothetical protein
MGWEEAKIKVNGVEVEGYANDMLVECPMPKDMEELKSVSVNGKTCKIGAYEIDTRDNRLKIILEIPDGTQKEAKSDGESAKG